MSKESPGFELVLAARPEDVSLTQWLYEELRRAILEGRLRRGAPLPATRDFAVQYQVSRGTVVRVYEQLQAEGYVESRVGSGTRVCEQLPDELLEARPNGMVPPTPADRPVHASRRASSQPFHPNQPAAAEFPMQVWVRLANRRLRRASLSLLADGEARGYLPLREAIAGYLGSSRGVRCTPEQIVVISGVQQGLDLLARLLLKPGDPVWMEDPGYPGAATVFRSAGARLIGVPVDAQGFDPAAGCRIAPEARLAYITPEHQFPLGATMPLERRMALLAWARSQRSFIIEDDYDSEYRFSGRPMFALQGLDDGHRVIFIGSFNKVLFPTLRIGYLVLPPDLVESFLALRINVDRYPPGMPQAILCDFIADGHLGRHLRRTREIYAERLKCLQECARRNLAGHLEISPIQAGLSTAALLVNGMTSQQAEAAAAAAGVESMGLHRFLLDRTDVHGLLLGFAGFEPRQIIDASRTLAAALDAAGPGGRR